MEQRRTCKLCLKTFSNGRALGGHMRSHMVTLQPQFPPPPPTPPKIQLGHHQQQQQQLRDIETTHESASSYSTEDEGEELCYGLRENPKKSFRLVDPEFSFAVVHDAGSSVVVHDVQDRESETESSKNPIRIRRSKRNRMKSGSSSAATTTTTTTTTTRFINQNQPKLKKAKSSKPIKAYHEFHEPEPVSSVSDTTPEEDVALCLMMLSRASWDSKQLQVLDEDEEEEEDDDDQKSKSKSIEDQESDHDDDDDVSLEEEEEEEEELKTVRNRNRPKYQCGTCKKVFRSYQALGGHRASHKKIRGCNIPPIPQTEEVESELGGGNAALPNTLNPVIDRKIHECPVCFRVFGSGQALGGHKRSHGVGLLTGSTSTNHVIKEASSKSIKFGDTLIDLNLPAPIEDDDYSQIELSAVSDAEFIDPIK